MQMQCPTTLHLHSSNVCGDLTQYAIFSTDAGPFLIDCHTHQCFQYEIYCEVEKLRGSIWVCCHIRCMTSSIWSICLVEPIHVNLTASEHLCHWIMSLCRIDGEPNGQWIYQQCCGPYLGTNTGPGLISSLHLCVYG